MRLYYISDEQRMVMELARSIAREKIAPVAAHHDETPIRRSRCGSSPSKG
jgi:hypothetical protein